jgi:hypothetical protein
MGSTQNVWVNMNRRGMVHDETCRWLIGPTGKVPPSPPYKLMTVTDAAKLGKRHCSHC